MWRRISEAWAAARLGTLQDLIFGYDLFICHYSDEAGEFASKLKERAEESTPSIRCFLDRSDFNTSSM